MIGDLGGLLLLNALLLLAGSGVAGAVGWWRGPRELARSAGPCYLVGVAAFGVVAQALYVCGAALSRWEVVAACLALGAAGVPAAVRSGSELVRPRDPLRALAIPVALVVVLIAVDLWYQPLWAYDSWTFWTPKAHALWALDGLHAGWFTQANLTSPDYPILLPAVEAAGFHFTGYETRLLDIQSLLFFVAFLLTVHALATGRVKSIVLWTVLAMLVLAPSVANQLASAEADIPVAVLFASAACCGARWLVDRSPPPLLLGSVLAAGAAATKVEGLVFLIAVFIALAFAAARLRGPRAAVAPLLAGVGAAAAGIVPWRIWLAIHHVPDQGSLSRLGDVGYLARHAARLPLVVAYMCVKMADPRAWLLVLPLFVVVLIVTRRTSSRGLFAYAIATVLVAFAGLALAYWSTPLGLHYQLATSARRVVTGLMFFAAAMTPLLAEERR